MFETEQKVETETASAGLEATSEYEQPSGQTDNAEGDIKDRGTLLTEKKETVEEEFIPSSPDEYKFNLKDEDFVDKDLLSDFTAYAHKKGISQKKASELVDLYEQAATKSAYAAQQELIDQEKKWRNQCISDPEIGGENFEKNKVLATRAVEEFGSSELITILDSTGYGSHPAIIKLFAKIGSKLAEKTIPTGTVPVSEPKSLAELMYPTMSK